MSLKGPWHADYFELKTMKAQLTQEEFFLLSLFLRDSDTKACFKREA